MDPESTDRAGGRRVSSSLSVEQKKKLKELLHFSKEEEEALSALSEEDQEAWYRVAQSWYAPTERLRAIDEQEEQENPRVAAIYVPSAEGVATYRGLFGTNGDLTPEAKERVCELLQQQIRSNGSGDRK